MNPRGHAVVAAGLGAYALVLVAGSLLGGAHLHELLPGLEAVRAPAAMAIAIAVMRRTGYALGMAAAFVAWFGVFGAITIAGQLFQRYGESDPQLQILIDPVTFAYSVASEVALILAAAGLTRSR